MISLGLPLEKGLERQKIFMTAREPGEAIAGLDQACN